MTSNILRRSRIMGIGGLLLLRPLGCKPLRKQLWRGGQRTGVKVAATAPSASPQIETESVASPDTTPSTDFTLERVRALVQRSWRGLALLSALSCAGPKPIQPPCATSQTVPFEAKQPGATTDASGALPSDAEGV